MIRDLFYRQWFPRVDKRIRIRDLRSLFTTTRLEDRAGPCFHCDDGKITRSRYPYSLKWREFRTNATSYPCELCEGTGVYVPKIEHEYQRPRSTLVLVARWTDPETMVTHSRLWTNKKRKGGRKSWGIGERQGMRPSCGNGGMRATLRRVDWAFDRRPITCPICLMYAERAYLRQAGAAGLPRTDQDDTPFLVSFSGCNSSQEAP